MHIQIRTNNICSVCTARWTPHKSNMTNWQSIVTWKKKFWIFFLLFLHGNIFPKATIIYVMKCVEHWTIQQRRGNWLVNRLNKSNMIQLCHGYKKGQNNMGFWYHYRREELMPCRLGNHPCFFCNHPLIRYPVLIETTSYARDVYPSPNLAGSSIFTLNLLNLWQVWRSMLRA